MAAPWFHRIDKQSLGTAGDAVLFEWRGRDWPRAAPTAWVGAYVVGGVSTDTTLTPADFLARARERGQHLVREVGVLVLRHPPSGGLSELGASIVDAAQRLPPTRLGGNVLWMDRLLSRRI